jgi:hypothetical protein
MIFNVSAVLVALNHRDPAVRLERIAAFASLIEGDFQVEPLYLGDHFIGLVDRLAPPRVEVAIG